MTLIFFLLHFNRDTLCAPASAVLHYFSPFWRKTDPRKSLFSCPLVMLSSFILSCLLTSNSTSKFGYVFYTATHLFHPLSPIFSFCLSHHVFHYHLDWLFLMKFVGLARTTEATEENPDLLRVQECHQWMPCLHRRGCPWSRHPPGRLDRPVRPPWWSSRVYLSPLSYFNF